MSDDIDRESPVADSCTWPLEIFPCSGAISGQSRSEGGGLTRRRPPWNGENDHVYVSTRCLSVFASEVGW